MEGYRASSVITATPQAVWDVLIDVGAWPSWDSGVVRVEGSPALGQKVTVFPEVNPERGFPVTVVDLRPGAGMTWRGGMPLGLFTGTRTYTVTEERDGKVTFEMQETYRGPLAGLMAKVIPDLSDSFSQFARGLKSRVETGH